ncbi:hypothetical protein L915_05826 [Phytophthora nicotianae]|uniref:Uncharacterized protein n=1 Tax=Phytophthora nicotianae TaxID=4792 RepID=W2H7J3_PHYNI|nr:hypothetical protein L915_05826 [Phytophthora nicotianae]
MLNGRNLNECTRNLGLSHYRLQMMKQSEINTVDPFHMMRAFLPNLKLEISTAGLPRSIK